MPTNMIRDPARRRGNGGGSRSPAAGGHSIDSPGPIYRLAVVGLLSTRALRRNSEARPGDVLILTKPLGVEIHSAAIKKGALSDEGYRKMPGFMTRLNVVGADLGRDQAVHAMTDITGFGLLGRALEMARGAALTLRLRVNDAPLLRQAEALARAGFVTGASRRNWGECSASAPLRGSCPLAWCSSAGRGDVRSGAGLIRRPWRAIRRPSRSPPRAPEIGVQHRAGEIEQRPHCRAILLLKAGESLSGNMLSAWDEASSGLQRRAYVVEHRANSVRGGRATISLDKDSSSWRIQDLVNHWQIAQTCGAHCL